MFDSTLRDHIFRYSEVCGRGFANKIQTTLPSELRATVYGHVVDHHFFRTNLSAWFSTPSRTTSSLILHGTTTTLDTVSSMKGSHVLLSRRTLRPCQHRESEGLGIRPRHTLHDEFDQNPTRTEPEQIHRIRYDGVSTDFGLGDRTLGVSSVRW